MNWITSSDIRNWAETRSRHCQETLPLLIRKLIRATSNSITRLEFASGDNIAIGGWDGILEITEATEYLPAGISGWEVGTDKGVKAKADSDYEKRTNDPLELNSSDTTFIFVTPRLWTAGKKWAKEKQKEQIWKDVRVINSEILEEWLEFAPTVAAWLAVELGKYPPESIQPPEDFWEEWSTHTEKQIKLSPKTLLSGRDNEINQLIESISNPTVIAIKDTSRTDALAFIIACFKNASKDDFFAKSLIIDSPDVFRKLSVHKHPLILIPRFDDITMINHAVTNGHTVIVPIGIDSTISLDKQIALPRLERKGFIESLTESGINKELAEKYSKESARNPSILKRLLNFPDTPKWATEDIRDLIPALLVGRWDESLDGDREIIAEIAQELYEKYIEKLRKWLFTQDSPILQFGTKWRLASPFDCWTHIARNITKYDFEHLGSAFLKVMTEISPIFDLEPEKRWAASVYGKNPHNSDWIREGLTQSMVIIAVFGNNNRDYDLSNSQIWVDNAIRELLDSDNALLWKSIANGLPLIAEASPKVFLEMIEKYLKVENSPIVALFEEENGGISPRSYHSGLLWALESIAWFNEYLARTSLILAKLTAIDPGGSLANRPSKTLNEIFKSWHYQTLADFNSRVEVLDLICHKEKEVGWNLLLSLLPSHFDQMTWNNSKMRWRLFDKELEKASFSRQEVFDTYSAIVDLLIKHFDNTEDKLADLITQSSDLSFLKLDVQDKLLAFIESNLDKVEQTSYTAWHTVRKLLSKHHSHPDVDWSMSEEELAPYEKLYHALLPSDAIQRTMWLFDENDPDFMEGFIYQKGSFDELQEYIATKRQEALADIYTEFGLEKIKQLSFSTKNPHILGDTLAHIVHDNSEFLSLCSSFKNKTCHRSLIHSFIFRKSSLNGISWFTDLYPELVKLDLSDELLGQLCMGLSQNRDIWHFIDSLDASVREYYWLNMLPWFPASEKESSLTYLLEFKRYFSAIDTCSTVADELESDLLVKILIKAATEESNEDISQFREFSYDTRKILEILSKRTDIDRQVLLDLSWIYYFSNNFHNFPVLLYDELSSKPAFFIHILKYLYKSSSNKHIQEQPTEQARFDADKAYDLLRDWKEIPGVDDNGEINVEFLQNWVTEARELAINDGLLSPADKHIGEILAQYPKNTDNWPPNEICEILEEVNTERLISGFDCAIINSRGMVRKDVFEGGIQEMQLAQQFEKYAQNLRNRYPIVSSILQDIATYYELKSKREDLSAEKGDLEY